MFAFVQRLGVIALLVTGALGHAELLEYWGGKGAGLQVYSGQRAYFLFDCSEGETTGWSVPGVAEGTTRPDTYTEPLLSATSFSPELVDAQTMKLTVTVEGQAPKVFELHRGKAPTLNNCPLH